MLGPYNGYSGNERQAKFDEMNRRMARNELAPPNGPCRVCVDPGGSATGVVFEYHDEDYGLEYSWSEPAAFVLCRDCHVYRLHTRFRYPLSWAAFLAHVRRGGYAREVRQPYITRELAAFRQSLNRGLTPTPLRALRPYAAELGTEWFARLSVDPSSLADPKSRRRPNVQ